MAKPTTPKPPAEVRAILARLQRDIVKLGNIVDAAEGEPGHDWTFEDLARLFAVLDRSGSHHAGLTQQLAAVRDQVKTRAAKSYPRGEAMAVVPGAGVLDLCSVGAKDRWEGVSLVNRIAAQVAEDVAVNPATGEIAPPSHIGHSVAAAIIDVAGLDTASATFRKSTLIKHKLVADDYCERIPGRLSVRFTD